jgi:hypothetical protein
MQFIITATVKFYEPIPFYASFQVTKAIIGTILRIFRGKSATTSRTGGMRMAPGRGRDHLCWCPLNYLNS